MSRAWGDRAQGILVTLIGVVVMVWIATPKTPERHNGLIINSLPVCTETQYLIYKSGGLACSELVQSEVTFPTCANGFVTSKKVDDVATLACQP